MDTKEDVDRIRLSTSELGEGPFVASSGRKENLTSAPSVSFFRAPGSHLRPENLEFSSMASGNFEIV